MHNSQCISVQWKYWLSLSTFLLQRKYKIRILYVSTFRMYRFQIPTVDAKKYGHLTMSSRSLLFWPFEFTNYSLSQRAAKTLILRLIFLPPVILNWHIINCYQKILNTTPTYCIQIVNRLTSHSWFRARIWKAERFIVR